MNLPNLDRIRTLLDEHGVDAMLITNGANRRYLSGYTAVDHAPDELAGVLVVSADRFVLFASGTNVAWARSDAFEGVEVRQSQRSWANDVAELVKEAGWTSLGFEDAATTVADYHTLQDALEGRDVQLTALGRAVDALRAVKSDEEIARLQTALRMTDEAWIAAETRIHPGMTEREAATIVDEEIRKTGSPGPSFATIVASGPNAAKPHHEPGDRKIQMGEPVIVDMGALYNGYAGDMTRTIWFGQPSEQLVTMYQAVESAFNAAVAKAGPGVTGVDFDAAARDVFAGKALDTFFVHSLGHGLGLRVHEAPSASMRSTDTLMPGNVVTIEPGLYIPDWGGIRIEDVVLITDDGAENLTGAPKRSLL